MATSQNEKYEPERIEPSDAELPKRPESIPAQMFEATDRLIDAMKEMDR